jgi:hypothetical protein
MDTRRLVGALALVAITAAAPASPTTPTITRQNAPLGISLDALQRRFPSCKLDRNPVGMDSPKDKAFFPSCLPSFRTDDV